MNYPKKSALLLGAACMLALPSLALAQDGLIRASNIIGSGMSNGLNQFGQVNNVLLDENGKAVEYLFFEASETFAPTRGEMGFVEIDNVDFSTGAAGGWEVVVEDTDAQRKPDELEVSRSEADHRLLSNVLEEAILFSDEESREIADILINPDTGEIEYFTVETDATSFFEPQMRSIPASEVEIGTAGKVSTTLSLAEVDTGDAYQTKLR